MSAYINLSRHETKRDMEQHSLALEGDSCFKETCACSLCEQDSAVPHINASQDDLCSRSEHGAVARYRPPSLSWSFDADGREVEP